MSRQGLRSATSGGDQSQEDLDRNLTETQENRGSSSSMDLGGHAINRSQEIEEPSESLTKKFEDLERRVKKMLEDERKRKEKLELEKERNLQKELSTMEAGINRSLEVASGITQTLEERNNRIEAQFGRLEAQQTRIMERINSEEGRREESRGLERNSNIIS